MTNNIVKLAAENKGPSAIEKKLEETQDALAVTINATLSFIDCVVSEDKSMQPAKKAAIIQFLNFLARKNEYTR
jgi:hypothetical protein